MSDIETKYKASLSVIWSETVLVEPGGNTEETVRVSIVNGTAKILITGFVICVPGNFDGDVEEVLDAYKRMVEEQSIAHAKMVDDSDESSCCNNLLVISQEELDELDELVREYEKDRGQVIDLKTGEWIRDIG